ncbi:MAG: hypothetical protein ABSB78_01585 [Bacteroidota bacterium]
MKKTQIPSDRSEIGLDDLSASVVPRAVQQDRQNVGVCSPELRITYDALSRRFTAAPPGKLYLLYGDAVIFRFALALASHALSHQAAIAVVDGCNKFDAHSIARFAREHRYSPDDFLNHIFISRGFTCYQMEAVVNDRLLPFIQRIGGNTAIIFGLLDTLYDEQAPLNEVRNILRRMVMRLHDMKAVGISVLLASRQWNVPDQRRNALFTTLQSGMDIVCRVEMNEEMKPKLYLEQPGKALHHGTDSTNIHQYHRCGNRQLVEIPPWTAQRRPGGVR